jgi:dGTPase
MMNWKSLISNKRLGQEGRHAERHDDRSEFRRDYDRLIFSAPFRRMQNKTQVFPLPGSIFVHNRLTHSLEVASVGRSLGDDVARRLLERHPELRGTFFEEIGNVVSAACLAHDMGNPPFGHSGEKAIQAYFTEAEGASLREKVSPQFWSDITHFEGNANVFRILTHRFKGRREGGFVMTYATLGSIVSEHSKKFGWTDREVTTHTFRHCLGTHMYEAGCDLFYIQKVLGHRAISSTLVYISAKPDARNPFEPLRGKSFV